MIINPKSLKNETEVQVKLELQEPVGRSLHFFFSLVSNQTPGPRNSPEEDETTSRATGRTTASDLGELEKLERN